MLLSLFPENSTLMPHPNSVDPVLVRTDGTTVAFIFNTEIQNHIVSHPDMT